MFLLQACRFTKRNKNSIGNSSSLLRVRVIIEFGDLNLEMDYQYKNCGGGGGSCTVTGIRAQHVNDHKIFRQPTGISVTHKMSDLEGSSF